MVMVLPKIRAQVFSKEAMIVLFVVVVMMASILLNIHTTTPYSPYNNHSDGYSEIVSRAQLSITFSIPVVEQTTFIIPLSKELDDKAVELLESLLKKGCTIVLLDEKGYSNRFLKKLGINVGVEPIYVLDEIYKVFSRYYPLTMLNIDNKTLWLATYKPTYISFPDEVEPQIVARTSKYAYADTNSDGYYTIGEFMDSYIVASSWIINNGSLWLITDLDVFKNDVLDLGNNSEILRLLVRNKKEVFLVVGYIDLGFVDMFKYWYSKLLPITMLKGVSTAIVVYIIALLLYMAIWYVEKK